MSSGYLLDTSFLIDLEQEEEDGIAGPATRALAGFKGGKPVWISAVTVAEFLESAEDEAAATLGAYRLQTIGWAAAQRCAGLQARTTRRLGENDAWQVSLALGGGLTLVGHDKAFNGRPGLDYLDHRKG